MLYFEAEPDFFPTNAHYDHGDYYSYNAGGGYSYGGSATGSYGGTYASLDPVPNYDEEIYIDFDVLNYVAPPDWLVGITNDLYDTIQTDPNVGPLLDWYGTLTNPGPLVTDSVLNAAAQGIEESYASGHYDNFIFGASTTYLQNTFDWGGFFDDYSSIF